MSPAYMGSWLLGWTAAWLWRAGWWGVGSVARAELLPPAQFRSIGSCSSRRGPPRRLRSAVSPPLAGPALYAAGRIPILMTSAAPPGSVTDPGLWWNAVEVPTREARDSHQRKPAGNPRGDSRGRSFSRTAGGPGRPPAHRWRHLQGSG